MRCFIALDIPQDFRDETAALARALKERVSGRFLDPENYHVTLAFLGDIDGHDLLAAQTALERAAVQAHPLILSADGLGKFGRTHDATLWLGLTSEGLAELAEAIRAELTAEEISFDNKNFRAHLTLARRAELPKGDLGELPFPEPACANTVTLYKSELTQDGPIYSALHQFQLV